MKLYKRGISLILLFTLSSFFLYSQEKLKGNKIVITEDRNIYDFTKIEVRDNIDIVLTQGSDMSVAVETDENLQEAVITELKDNTLIVELSTKITRKKVLKVFITVDETFEELITKDRSDVLGDGSFTLDSFSINAEGNSKISMNLKPTHFYLNNNESANVSLTVNAEEIYIKANKTGRSKITMNANTVQVIGLGNSTTELIGSCVHLEVNGENRSNVKGATLESDEVVVNASDNADIHVNAKNTITLAAINASEIYIYNSPVITIEKFTDKAILRKK